MIDIVRPMAGRAGKRSKKLSANASEDEIAAFYEACSTAEIEPSDTLRKLAHALKLHVDEYGNVTFPIRIAAPPRKNDRPHGT